MPAFFACRPSGETTAHIVSEGFYNADSFVACIFTAPRLLGGEPVTNFGLLGRRYSAINDGSRTRREFWIVRAHDFTCVEVELLSNCRDIVISESYQIGLLITRTFGLIIPIQRQFAFAGLLERVDIRAMANKLEPQRSDALRKVRSEIIRDLEADIARYRQCVFQLYAYRRATDSLEVPSVCDDIHVAVSLKHNHIVNDFAHLVLLDELPAQQGDLFAL